MSARAEFGPLSWEEIEQNRAETLAQMQREFVSQCGNQAQTNWSWQAPEVESEPVSECDSLIAQRDRLRNEIRRGKEYLAQIEKDLTESRALLETWPAYEKQCGKNPLPQITQAISVNEQIQQFLPRWLARQEEKLAAVIREIESTRRESGSEQRCAA